MLDVPYFRRRRLRSPCWIVAVLLAALVFVASGVEIAAAATPRANMSWHEIDTAHFRIFKWQAPNAHSDDSDLKSTCEEAITRQSTYWFGRVEPLDRKCVIILYPNNESYFRAVGGNATQTAGTVLTGFDGQLAFSRIELPENRSDWETACLPHELTHVLLAQRFAGRKLPAWINEGTALLADPASKQSLHLRDCHRALRNGTAFALMDLMSLTDYPDHRSWPAFYGQSLSLAKCLVERQSPRAFVDFIDKSLKYNYTTALREVYDIQDIARLQQIWSQYVSQCDVQLDRSTRALKHHLSGSTRSTAQ